MVERVILLCAALLVGLLFIYAVVIAPEDKANRPGNSMGKIEIGNEKPQSPPDDEWFLENVISSETPVLVDFKADWCGPCRLLHPHIVKVEEKYKGQLKVVQVDVDEKGNIARHYQASSIPTVLLFVDGAVVDGFIGYLEFEEIEKIVLKHISDETNEATGEETDESKTAVEEDAEAVPVAQ